MHIKMFALFLQFLCPILFIKNLISDFIQTDVYSFLILRNFCSILFPISIFQNFITIFIIFLKTSVDQERPLCQFILFLLFFIIFTKPSCSGLITLRLEDIFLQRFRILVKRLRWMFLTGTNKRVLLLMWAETISLSPQILKYALMRFHIHLLIFHI